MEADARDLLTALLAEFADLFAEPKGLPPAHAFDHRIHLLPGTPPVAVRPYLYAQLLKDEIEAQCRAMLEQGIIRASTSAFSSRVLLVRKHDGTAKQFGTSSQFQLWRNSWTSLRMPCSSPSLIYAAGIIRSGCTRMTLPKRRSALTLGTSS